MMRVSADTCVCTPRREVSNLSARRYPLKHQIIQGILIFLFGAIVTHFWSKYRTRLRPIRWSVSYFRVAVATADPQFGTVQVVHDGTPVANVHTAFIQIENESNSDLENVVVNMACLEGSCFLRSIGIIDGGLQFIPYTDAFWTMMTKQQHLNPAYAATHREFRIPVLNRGTRANFSLLLSRDDALEPSVSVSCNHLGVDFKLRPPTTLLWGVSLASGVWVGIAAALICVIALALEVHSVWIVGVTAWFLGTVESIFGVGILKLSKWFVRQLG
jgi:hypothetical protein